MTAVVEHGGIAARVTLRNLSSDGALVEGDHGLSKGMEVLFRKNDLSVSGTVAWVEDRKAGIAFAMSLDPETVLRNVPTPTPLRALVHKRPGFRSRMSPEERCFGEVLWDRPLPSVEK